MAVIKIYGVQSAYNADCREWYRLRPDAEKACSLLNQKFPTHEFRVVCAYYDDGEGD